MRAPTIAAVVVAATLGAGAYGAHDANAGPALRFGLTGAIADEGAPGQHQLGPMIGVGTRLGPALLEVDYAYLSFMEPDVSAGGMHRLGVNLRADLYRDTDRPCVRNLACTRAFSIYGELGAAMRYGQWHLDHNTSSPASSDRQREAHIAIGIELDNTIVPTRYGWQFGFRVALAPRDDLMFACRGSGCAAAGGASGPTGELDLAYLLEWSFLVGR